MRLRGPARFLALALLASLLSPVVLRPTPALAHGPCTASSETDYYPSTSPWSDGVKVRIRMVSPNGGTSCPSKPAAGWPLIIYTHGGGSTRCEDMSFASRAEMATWGYVVLSFTMRGRPAPPSIGQGGCNQLDNATDALDDGGLGDEARNKLDVTELITWAKNNYTPSNCSSQCVDESKVGVTGFSLGGHRAFSVGVPNPPNAQFDSRVKAIAPSAAYLLWDNVKNLSNDGAATPTRRPHAISYTSSWWGHQGWLGSTDRGTTHGFELDRDRFLNLSVPTATTDYMNGLYDVDDDATVDKAGDVTMPVFFMNGWLDANGAIYNQIAIEAYNKVPTSNTDRYLYLGSCGHSPDPCHTNNRAKMRDALHRFFDRYVRGDTSVYVRPPGTATCATTGPCVIYTIPPKYVTSTNNPWYTDNWSETSATAWPPSGYTTETRYFRNAGTLTTTSESGTTCTPGTPPAKGTGCSTFTNDLNLPVYYDYCIASTYGSTEVQSYDWSFTADKKVAKFEADLYLKSDTTRQQVYVDLELRDSSNNFILRVWQGTSQVAPVKRDGTAGTVYRFKFVPGGAAWTVANGQKLRFKVASKYAKAFAGEPLPATYTLYHNANTDGKSAITLTYVS